LILTIIGRVIPHGARHIIRWHLTARAIIHMVRPHGWWHHLLTETCKTRRFKSVFLSLRCKIVQGGKQQIKIETSALRTLKVFISITLNNHLCRAWILYFKMMIHAISVYISIIINTFHQLSLYKHRIQWNLGPKNPITLFCKSKSKCYNYSAEGSY